MPKTVRQITCCYCDASTMIDLAKIGRGVLTCDACGARLSSARMEALVNRPVPVKRSRSKHTAPLAPRWQGVVGPFGSGMNQPKKKPKYRKKKRKSFLDRLEDIWDEIEDIID